MATQQLSRKGAKEIMRKVKAEVFAVCFSFATLRETLPDPDPVVTIQCRGIRNYDLLAFAQPVEYLDGAKGVAAEFNCATLSFSAVGTQDKHADRLLRLTKRGPADLQDVFESLELDRSVHTQIRSCTRR